MTMGIFVKVVKAYVSLSKVKILTRHMITFDCFVPLENVCITRIISLQNWEVLKRYLVLSLWIYEHMCPGISVQRCPSQHCWQQ